jgi:hypothetical protein
MTTKDLAAAVKAKAVELKKQLPESDLLALWVRLPGVMSSTAPTGNKLAESVAYYLIDMGDSAPSDLEDYIAKAPKLRESKVSAAVEEKNSVQGEAHTVPLTSEAASGDSAASIPQSNNEENTVQTQEATSSKPARKGKGKAVKPDAVKKTAAKKAAKKTNGDHKPRENGIANMVRTLTLDGKTNDEIAKIVAKAHPDTKFAKEDAAGQSRFVAWAQWDGRRKKLLPPKAAKEPKVKVDAAPKAKRAPKKAAKKK